MRALAFFRGAMGAIAFRFLDATVNLGDVGTKHVGSLGVIDQFPKTRRFPLSFVGKSSFRGR